MKFRILLLLILFSHRVSGQSIKDNIYSNDKIKVTFHFDKSWSLSFGQKDFLFAAVDLKKGELVTFHYIKNNKPQIEKFTPAQLEATRLAYIRKYESEGHTVINVSVTNDGFLNHNGFTVLLHSRGQSYLNGIPIYKKQVTFLTKTGYLVSFIYIIPERIYTTKEIFYVESQLKTFTETE